MTDSVLLLVMMICCFETSGLERLAQEFLTVSVHSCLYSIEAEQNKKAEEEVGEYRTSSFDM